MGLCKDEATSYLKRLGYNVVRHPQEGVSPLDLIGRQSGTTTYLGTLNQLITNPPGPLPAIQTDLAATDVDGQRSSRLNIALGANILGAVIGAMGGSLGVDTSYTNARSIEFLFAGVLKDRATPLDVGNYLRDGSVDSGNKILSEYVIGNGQLYLVLETIKSNKITVKYEREQGIEAKVDIPVIEGLVGGNVSVTAESEARNVVTYQGSIPLTFGFKCYEVGVEEGELTLMASKPGAVPLAASLESDEATLAAEATLLSPEGVGLLELVLNDSESS